MPAIHAICGLPGAGKTAFMTLCAIRWRKRDLNIPICSNYPLYLPGKPVVYVDTFQDAMKVRDCQLLLDELHVWLGSRDWKEHGKELSEWVSQLRKAHVDLWYTTQDMQSVDRMIRERTLNSYWVTSYRKLGFFAVEEFLGISNTKKGARCGIKIFPVSEVLYASYDTDHIVRI